MHHEVYGYRATVLKPPGNDSNLRDWPIYLAPGNELVLVWNVSLGSQSQHTVENVPIFSSRPNRLHRLLVHPKEVAEKSICNKVKQLRITRVHTCSTL